MNFYGRNIAKDRNFLNLYTKLNHAFWIASDIDHYYDTYKNDISNIEFLKIKREFQETVNNVKNINLYLYPASKEQLECLKLVKHFLIESMMQLEINKNSSLHDSESEAIALQYACELQNNFFENISKYLYHNEMEFYLQSSYKLFQNALDGLSKLELKLECQDDKETYNIYKQIIADISLPRLELEKGLSDPMVFNSIIDEYLILNKNIMDESSKEYINLHINFMKLWKEYFTAIENNFIKNFNDDDMTQEDKVTEGLMFEYEIKNYLALININAIKISVMTLKKFNIEVPRYEIYSSRVIKSPSDYIQNRLA